MLFKQFNWLLSSEYPCIYYSPPDQKMVSRFAPVTDEKSLVLNEAAVSPNTKKATTFCSTVCIKGIPNGFPCKIARSMHEGCRETFGKRKKSSNIPSVWITLSCLENHLVNVL